MAAGDAQTPLSLVFVALAIDEAQKYNLRNKIQNNLKCFVCVFLLILTSQWFSWMAAFFLHVIDKHYTICIFTALALCKQLCVVARY